MPFSFINVINKSVHSSLINLSGVQIRFLSIQTTWVLLHHGSSELSCNGLVSLVCWDEAPEFGGIEAICLFLVTAVARKQQQMKAVLCKCLLLHESLLWAPLRRSYRLPFHGCGAEILRFSSLVGPAWSFVIYIDSFKQSNHQEAFIAHLGERQTEE